MELLKFGIFTYLWN
ncbi:UNVERIFIED_CONTAM: hypothetical protein NCL1_53282 [Trichonephila clavipes]